MDPAISALITFLVEELRAARSQALPVSAEFQLQLLLWHSSRRTRRLERLAHLLSSLDAQTSPESKPE